MSDTASFHSAYSSPRSASPAVASARSSPRSASPAAAPAKAPSPRPASPSDSIVRFTPEEEAELIASSNTEKATANKLYGSGQLSEAVGAYDYALSFLPAHLDYEIAVLKSNIAACHLRLEEWKQAAEAADAALDGLEHIVPSGKKRKKAKRKQTGFEWKDTGEGERPLRDEEEEGEEGDGRLPDDAVVELDGDDEEAAQKLAALQINDERREQVANLRAKSLLRRAKANVALSGWSNLASAEEDYKDLVQMPNLPLRDRAFARKQLSVLPPRIQAAREKEMGEVMGKLKELGNGLLKPFGLSTDMFNVQKDEKTGGYSMSFN